mmetsp:Transcript_29473/g.60345  ORF Transcript_29473/g.60345 Transcript_29473/m.60345 type:complete len:1391 (+) Transcript_29473:80-4252(+)
MASSGNFNFSFGGDASSSSRNTSSGSAATGFNFSFGGSGVGASSTMTTGASSFAPAPPSAVPPTAAPAAPASTGFGGGFHFGSNAASASATTASGFGSGAATTPTGAFFGANNINVTTNAIGISQNPSGRSNNSEVANGTMTKNDNQISNHGISVPKIRALAWDPTGPAALSLAPLPGNSSSFEKDKRENIKDGDAKNTTTTVGLDVFLSHDGTGCTPEETECLLRLLGAREQWLQSFGKCNNNGNADGANANGVTELSMEYRAALCDCLVSLQQKLSKNEFERSENDDGKEDKDDDDDDDDEEEEEDGDAKRASKRSRGDSDDGESEDDEEDDKTSKKNSKKDNGGKGKKKKRSKISFFDEEAEASDDDDEDDDLPYGTHKDPDDVVRKHYTEEDIRKEYRDEEAEAIIAQQDRRRQRAGGWLGGLGGLDGREDDDYSDAARIARELEERHRMERRIVHRERLDVGRRGGGGAREDRDIGRDDDDDDIADAPAYTAVAQQSLVPSVSDPNLWMFNCPTGKEQDLVYQIMNKCVAHAKRGRPLGITSVVAAQTKGKIYVESYSEPAVMEAVQGVRGLMQYSMRLVPLSDMTTVMTVVPKKVPVKKNDWVRMARGHFKGDLALVKHVRESGLKCVIQCVPRIDLTLSDLPPEEAKIRRRTVRPPQKFFNSQEIAAMGKHGLRQRFPGLNDVMCDYFDGNYYHDGYLLKEVTIGTVVKPCTAEDPPTLDELQRFRRKSKSGEGSGYDDGNDDEENEGSKMAESLLSELSELQGKTGLASAGSNDRGLMIGDTIEVIEGDLVGMQGKILSLDGTTVKVRPNNDAALADLGGMDEVEFLVSQVRKHIAVGAHVKVMDGRYANETGVVVAVESIEGDEESDFDCTAVVLTDMTHKEISVRTSQLQESAEIASGQDKLAGYELHDLVVLSGGGAANEVGVIVRVGREEFTVINNHGIAREARPEELRGKRNGASNRAVALDVQANQIRCGDSVTIVEGPHKGKVATIKRMSRAQLFLYSQFRSEHSGIFVVRSRSCVLTGGSKSSRNAGASGAPGDSPFSTPRSQSGRDGPMRGERDDSLMGKTVRIQAGQWKGYLGTVSHTTPTHVQVELHSRLKKVMVVKERVHVIGDKFGATDNGDDNNGVSGVTTPAFVGGMTPMHGGATPMHGGATPMHGGATPMHDGYGGATPSDDNIWRPGGSLDRENEGGDKVEDDDGWGSSNGKSTYVPDNPFGDSAGENNEASSWGASSERTDNTWTPGAGESENPFKQEPDTYDHMHHDGGAMGTIEGTGEEAAVWFMERVCVQLKQNDKHGVIKDINGSTAVVELEDKSTLTVRHGEVSMVPPQEHDMVLVTGGADVGVEGELVCIDGTDAILKESNENFKIVDFVHLAKIASG